MCWLLAHLPKHVPKIDRLCTAKINSRQWVKTICVLTGSIGITWSSRVDWTTCCIVYSGDALACFWTTVKKHDWETQSGPAAGESAKLNVFQFFLDGGGLEFFNGFPYLVESWSHSEVDTTVNQMKAVRRALEVFEWIRMWLGCILTSFWRALLAANIWRTSPGTRGPCKAELEEWKTNQALCHYHCGDAAESTVAVQTATHRFHVSKRF